MFVKAVLFTSTLACVAMGQTALDISDLPEDQHKIVGTLVFEADNLTEAQAAAAVQLTLANKIGVAAQHISVTATKSRRLGEQVRRLADTWTVAYEIYVDAALAEDFKATARNLNDASWQNILQIELRKHIMSVGSSEAAVTVSLTSILSDNVEAAEEEADGAHTLSFNFFFVLAVFMVTSAITKEI